MKTIRLLCLVLSSFFLTHAFAQSTIISTNSFTTVQRLIAQDRHPHHLLLAMDDDDTLTMEPCYPYSVGTGRGTQCQYIGGPTWFSWQAGLPANNPDRIWKTFPQLLAIQNLLFTISAMPLDDPAIPATLKTAIQRHAHVIVASARGYSMMNATEQQFAQDGILKLIEKGAITTTPDGSHISFPGFYMPKPWNNKPVRHIAYVHGVFYLSGQNKGQLIKQLLAKTKETQQIHEIVFVDDTMQNVIDVANAFKNDPHVHAICIHYLRLANHKAAFKSGKNAKALQAIAAKQWKQIQVAMSNSLVGSTL